MKKAHRSKLRVHRETIRPLEAPELSAAAGGWLSCFPILSHCICITKPATEP